MGWQMTRLWEGNGGLADDHAGFGETIMSTGSVTVCVCREGGGGGGIKHNHNVSLERIGYIQAQIQEVITTSS